MYFWEDFCVLVLIIGGMIGAFLGAVFLLCNFANSNECDKYAAIAGAKTYFSWSTGCLVLNEQQKWVSLEAVTKNNADVTVRQK